MIVELATYRHVISQPLQYPHCPEQKSSARQRLECLSTYHRKKR